MKTSLIICLGVMMLLAETLTAQTKEKRIGLYASIDNDYFTGTDVYYTHGVDAGILINPKATTKKNKYYHIILSQDIYTPSSLSDKNIRHNDYPYAGLLIAQGGKTKYNQHKNSRLQHYIDLGIMGPNAKGQEVQTWFHKIIDDELPQGWEHQVKTKIIVNYGNFYERRLFKVQDRVESISGAGVFIGTLKTGFDLALKHRFGLLRPYFQSPFQNRKNAIELYSDVHFIYLINNGILNTSNQEGLPIVDENLINNTQWKVTMGLLIHLSKVQINYSLSRINEPIQGIGKHSFGTLGFIVFI